MGGRKVMLLEGSGDRFKKVLFKTNQKKHEEKLIEHLK